ncbi:hypothetical protein [Streptomyces sp. HD]|uniref:hypothetical protein n=1 Tax=Streptomyces sp. HD TaxID=3020892 RepID=UPI002330782A|nr:hypothetical protein [Streptomyces sp. HD]MDC0765486.1 hypothetical protein [Streptomyces sp. HD]
MIEVAPPDRMGPVSIGMSVDAAEAALRAHGAVRVGEQDGLRRGVAYYASGLSLHVHTGTGGLVNAVEAFRPINPDVLSLNGIDLFSTPAHEVESVLRGFTEVEIEERGCMLIAPDLLLSLWRPYVAESSDDRDGYYFESALVANPGYYD